MGTQFRGIVVAYNGMCGVVLLRHHSFQTIGELAKAYAESKIDKGFWFAKFSYQDLSLAERKASKKLLVHDMILGRQVACEIAKDAKWHCISISFMKRSRRLELPTRRYVAHEMMQERRESKGAKAKSKESQRDRRIQRLSQQVTSNATRPWGGMSN